MKGRRQESGDRRQNQRNKAKAKRQKTESKAEGKIKGIRQKAGVRRRKAIRMIERRTVALFWNASLVGPHNLFHLHEAGKIGPFHLGEFHRDVLDRLFQIRDENVL